MAFCYFRQSSKNLVVLDKNQFIQGFEFENRRLNSKNVQKVDLIWIASLATPNARFNDIFAIIDNTHFFLHKTYKVCFGTILNVIF